MCIITSVHNINVNCLNDSIDDSSGDNFLLKPFWFGYNEIIASFIANTNIILDFFPIYDKFIGRKYHLLLGMENLNEKRLAAPTAVQTVQIRRSGQPNVGFF